MIECPICGKQFQENGNRRKYCSIECSQEAKYLRDKRWRETHEKPKKAKDEKPLKRAERNRFMKCAYCGKEFELPEGSPGNRKYCCKECQKKAAKELTKSAEKAKKANKKGRPFDSLAKEIKAYNEKHGTNLSYGQYQAKLYMEAHSRS